MEARYKLPFNDEEVYNAEWRLDISEFLEKNKNIKAIYIHKERLNKNYSFMRPIRGKKM